MDQFTPNQALADAIEESGLRKGFIAKRIGVKPWTLSRWLSGELVPGELEREKLALILRRDAGDFLPSARVDATTPTDVGHGPEVSTLPTTPHDDHVGDLDAAA